MRVEQRQVVASRPRAVRFSTVMQGVGVIMVFRRTPRPLSAVRFVGGCMRKCWQLSPSFLLHLHSNVSPLGAFGGDASAFVVELCGIAASR